MPRKEVSIAILLIAILWGGGIIETPLYCVVEMLKNMEKSDLCAQHHVRGPLFLKQGTITLQCSPDDFAYPVYTPYYGTSPTPISPSGLPLPLPGPVDSPELGPLAQLWESNPVIVNGSVSGPLQDTSLMIHGHSV